jgi:predicted nucleic acid-binding protein
LRKPTPFNDTQIKGIDKVEELILGTDNLKDFKNFEDLHVENWKV